MLFCPEKTFTKDLSGEEMRRVSRDPRETGLSREGFFRLLEEV